MKLKKRAKSSRHAGSQTHKRGKKARTRGSGNQGGKGWSGTGKRGDQKKTLVIKLTGGNNYFGKSRTLRRGNLPAKVHVINLDDISRRLTLLVSQGKAKEEKGKILLDFSDYKVLGDGQITKPVIITAFAVSASAQEKITAAGGEVVLGKKGSSASVDKKEVSQKKKTTKESSPKAKN